MGAFPLVTCMVARLPDGRGRIWRVEIIPGVGVELARIGESRNVVEARTGAPVHPGQWRQKVYNTSPMLSVHYTQDDLVELVEIGYSGHHGGPEVFFDGIQLTYRFMDDVVADLAAKGLVGVPFDIGFSYEPGFSIFSMSSLWALDLDPNASEHDERNICEGVGIAPFDYFRDPTPEELAGIQRTLP